MNSTETLIIYAFIEAAGMYNAEHVITAEYINMDTIIGKYARRRYSVAPIPSTFNMYRGRRIPLKMKIGIIAPMATPYTPLYLIRRTLKITFDIPSKK